MAKRRPLFEVTTRIIRDRELSSSEKLIYLLIAAEYRTTYRNPVNYLSFEDLSRDAGFSEKTVRRALKRLSDVGLIRFASDQILLSIDLLHLDNDYSVLRQLASAGGS